jgi:hypothetical protein
VYTARYRKHTSTADFALPDAPAGAFVGHYTTGLLPSGRNPDCSARLVFITS